MFSLGRQLLGTAQSCLRQRQQLFQLSALPRLFSTTRAVEAGYKMKSHSGAKKRWRSLGSGNLFKRVRRCLSLEEDLHLTLIFMLSGKSRPSTSQCDEITSAKEPSRYNRIFKFCTNAQIEETPASIRFWLDNYATFINAIIVSIRILCHPSFA